MEVLCFNNFRNLNKSWVSFVKILFCCFMDFGVFLRPIRTNNCSYLFQVAYWIPRLVTVEFSKFFMPINISKNVQKLHRKVKNLQVVSFCIIWVILRTLSSYKNANIPSKVVLWTCFSHLEIFQASILPKHFNLK